MNPEEGTDSSVPPASRRIIKRYSNRKLYDTQASAYVTLLQIAEMIREGEDVQIIDNATKVDKTDVTLALIISEELKSKPRAIPLPTLKALVRHRGERILTQLREGPIGRLIPKDELAPDESVLSPPTDEDDMSQNKDAKGGLRATLEHWQAAVDERIRAVLPNFSAFRELEQQVSRLNERLEALERRLGQSPPSDKPPEASSSAKTESSPPTPGEGITGG
jgi:polyhydroxyalkanoate synthesis repressor PhaR